MQEVESALVRAGWPADMVKEYIGLRAPTVVGPSAVKCVGVSKDVLQSIDVDIVPGEIFGITGLPESGYNTLLQLMAGIIQPDQGSVHLSKPRIGFVPAQPALIDTFSVRENIEHWIRVGNTKLSADNLLQQAKLLDVADQRVNTLPIGLRKIIDILCGVANNPSILFIEEPVQGVDPASEKEIWSLIRTVSKNKTVVIASHPCPALEFLCTRIAVVSKGRIVQMGTPQQFRGSAKGIYVIRIELEKNTKALLTALTKHKAKIINGKCVATTKQPMQVCTLPFLMAVIQSVSFEKRIT